MIKREQAGSGPSSRCAAIGVIDGDSATRKAFAKTLRAHVIYAFESGEAALVWFNKHPSNRIALVFCGNNLSGLSSVETIWKLRSFDPNRRFVLMSDASLQDPERLVRQGFCNAFLPKPFKESELKGMVQTMLKSDCSGRAANGSDGCPPSTRRGPGMATAPRVPSGRAGPVNTGPPLHLFYPSLL